MSGKNLMTTYTATARRTASRENTFEVEVPGDVVALGRGAVDAYIEKKTCELAQDWGKDEWGPEQSSEIELANWTRNPENG